MLAYQMRSSGHYSDIVNFLVRFKFTVKIIRRVCLSLIGIRLLKTGLKDNSVAYSINNHHE
jgi:hypothetical protein